MRSETGAGVLILAVSERRKVPLTFSISVLARPVGEEEGLCSWGPDPGGEAESGEPGQGSEGRARSGGCSHPHARRPPPTHCPAARAPLGLASLSAPTRTGRSAWQSPVSAASEGFVARGWTRGVGCLGKPREKVGVGWREGRGGRRDAPGAGEEGRMGRPEA